MSDSTPTPTTSENAPPEATASTKPQGNPLGNLISRMSLTQLTLAVLVIVFVWQWVAAHGELNQVQQEVARRLAEVEGTNKANQTLVTQNQELVRELGGKLSLLESRFAETQSQRESLEALYEAMSSSRDQTALADVEQMVLIADQQLQLSANVKAALIALQHAESRLKELNRPAFSGLLNHINSDIERLRALPTVDVPAYNLQLDTLINAADTLPLIQDLQPSQIIAPTSTPTKVLGAWDAFWQELWQEIRNLVRIENMQQEVMPLLSPDQTFFLRENLKLRLLNARLSLASHDEANFLRELKTTQNWIKRYFDPKSAETAKALALIQQLEAAKITVNVPDISGSLNAVRTYRTTHDKGAQ
ncbi:MAG: uroporphyrinogen-III C-methyltransferase [Sideroxydans sp.]|nr:uroporphyrinogen-III C-methyltransferase [Sideroxydans sp.]